MAEVHEQRPCDVVGADAERRVRLREDGVLPDAQRACHRLEMVAGDRVDRVDRQQLAWGAARPVSH